MSERRKSTDSFASFFAEPKREEKKYDETSPAIAALIRSQPVLHHRQTSSDREAVISTQRTPVTSPQKKITPLDSTRTQNYDSDFDLDKLDSIRTEAQSKLKLKPKEDLQSRQKKSFPQPVKALPRKKERYLPYIRKRKVRKTNSESQRVKTPRNEVEQRLYSAQQNKCRQLESYLADLKRQLDEERRENRTLREIQKREEKSLKQCEDQEYEAHRITLDFQREIDKVQKDLDKKRDTKDQLKLEIDDRDQQLHKQKKKIRYFEKIINDEPQLDSSQQLKDKLDEVENKLKEAEKNIKNREKKIKKLENEYRDEIQDELSKRRELRRQLEQKNKSFEQLLQKVEAKSRQVDTMHIYIQRGGRRPSTNSISLRKSHSLQSLVDLSPRFREKALEYDKKRRQHERLKPKPKPKPLPAIPSKVEPKKYPQKIVSDLKIDLTPKKNPYKVDPEPKIESMPKKEKKIDVPDRSYLFSNEKVPGVLTRESHIEDDNSNHDEDTTYQSTVAKSPSTIDEYGESYKTQAKIHHRRSPDPLPPLNTRLVHSGQQERRNNISHLPKSLEPLAPTTNKTLRHRKFDDKWMDFFDDDNKRNGKQDDLLSNLISHAPTEKKVEKRSDPTLIMFEPSTDNTRKRPENSFDKSQSDFQEPELESIFTKSTTKRTTRDDTFTVGETKVEPFTSYFGPSKTSFTDKMSRPKLITNPTKTLPNSMQVDDVEDIFA